MLKCLNIEISGSSNFVERYNADALAVLHAREYLPEELSNIWKLLLFSIIMLL